ncbi:isocitrate lyase/PEP mutase family protein [Geotalea sp. SG265]|uniref:isocitrate lyase/PEP mutase family protein n=1 Tax=Geotalea sp. SG265 TaxID=2922867 RepID=UPI001FAFB237|nr:isocitrate lyase/PEP mutase family protein [Geotalea sp. SG265]
MMQCQLLRALLKSERPLLMPDAYDAMSARMIENAGFKAVQCSGFSMALAVGCKTEDDLSLERNLQITQDIIRAVSVPVMADGEDGFGPPEKVAATVKAFVNIGASGINLEDQILRSSGHKGVIDTDLMVEKIIVARKAAEEREMSDLVINGRTDALAVATDRKSGLRDAIDRATRYLESGADLVFVTSVVTLDEAKTLAKEIPGPLSIAAGLPNNIGTLAIDDLTNCGLARISLPTIAVFATIQALKQTFRAFTEKNDLQELQRLNLLCSMDDVAKLK